MKCLACISDGKVLKSNGIYQHVSHIRKGDKLFNMYGKSVTVRNVQYTQGVVLPTIDIKHDCWFSTLQCTEGIEILTWDNTKKLPRWVQGDYFGEIEHQQTIILPTNLEWELPLKLNGVLMPSNDDKNYPLGFLIGAYLRIGYQKQRGVIGFHCDTGKKAVEKYIVSYMSYLFGVEPKYRRGTFTIDVDFECSALYEMFSEFTCKGVPSQYIYQNTDYIQGINDGLVFSGTNGYPTPENTNVFEVLYWSSLFLGKPLHFGQLAHKYNNVSFLTGRANLHSYQRQKTDLWKIDVDCISGTFIVNNMVVRNVE